MNWIDASWTVMAAACLTLASIHLLVWNQQRSDKAHLAFSVAGVSIAVTGLFELLMMHAHSAGQYAALLRWAHVPFAILVPCLVAFVRLHLRVGRAWLGHLAWILRVVVLVPDFTTGVNLNFREISGLLEREAWGGARFMTPVGEPNPWMILGQASSYLLLAFFLDAALTQWRKPTRASSAKIIRICSSMALFILLATTWHLAVVVGGMQLPVAILPAFTGVFLVMSYELGGDVIRARELSKNLSAAVGTLRQSEKRIEDAVLAAGFGIWDWDLPSGEMWLSPRARALLWVGGDEPLDRARFLQRVHPFDRTAVSTALDVARSSAGPFVFEFRIAHANGVRRWLLVRGQAETDFDRTPTRLCGVLVDITERKRSDEKFRIVVESAPVAMIVVGDDGRVRFANRRAEQDFGRARKELIGLAVDRLVPAPYLEAARRNAAPGGALFGLRSDGRHFQIEAVTSPIELEGEPAELISVTDISERKRMERESTMQRDELAHLSRVALLAELTGSLAHELNQPLTSILSNAQAALRFMAHESPDLAEVRDSLESIVESDKLAGEVIRRLRKLLRKEPADFQAMDVNEVVQEVLRIVHSDLLSKRVEVRLDLQANLPQSEGDRVQLQQVLLNLILNGSDAMQERRAGRELTVTTSTATATARASGGMELVVSDLGHGIPPADLERIFSPFVTSKPEGMGLGLAVCWTIIDSHHGRLWATNNDGPGASVHVWLPAIGQRAVAAV